jgi:ubiquinone/menaquinone biosynthesis C-methylase UbiE
MPRKSETKNRETTLTLQRLETLDTHRVMSLIPVMPYHTVADIACGTGYFTVPLAKYVFDGKVYAVDTQQDALDTTKQAVDKLRLTNVEAVLTKERKLNLEDDSLDGVLAPFAFSNADEPERLLKDVHRVLHRGGWLAALEWNAKEGEDGPPADRRVGEDALRQMGEKAGFRFTGRHHLNDAQYMLLLRK